LPALADHIIIMMICRLEDALQSSHFVSAESKLSQKPYVFSVNNDMYDCESCVPKINVKADGQDGRTSQKWRKGEERFFCVGPTAYNAVG